MEITTYVLKALYYQFDPVLIGKYGAVSFYSISMIPDPQGHSVSAVTLPPSQQPHVPEMSQIYITDFDHLDEIEGCVAPPAAIICAGVTNTSNPRLWKFHVPVLALRQDCPVDTLYKSLLYCLFSMHQDDAFYSSLTSALLSGDSLKHILELSYTKLGTPLVVVRRDLHVIAENCLSVTDQASNIPPEILDFIRNGQFLPVFENMVGRSGLFQKLSNSSHPIHSPCGAHADIVFAPMHIGEVYVGSVLLFLFDRTPIWRDFYMAGILGEIVSSVIRRDHMVLESDSSPWGDILRDLILSQPEDPSLRSGLKAAGLCSDAPKVLVQMRPLSQEQDLTSLQQQLTDAIPAAKAFLLPKCICMLLPLNENLAIPEKALSALEHLLQRNDLIAGVSGILKNPLALRFYFQQTDTVLSAAHTTNDIRIYWYQDFVIDHVLDISKKIVPLESICPPAIRILKEYDERHDTQYLSTLRTYIECSMSISESSRKLVIHYNTMKYRLKVISELTGLNLMKTETAVNLNIAFKMLYQTEHPQTP